MLRNVLGFGFKITPFFQIGTETVTAVSELVSLLPENIFMQLQIFGSKQFDDLIEKFREEHYKRALNPNSDNYTKEVMSKSIDLFINFLKTKKNESLSKSMITKLKTLKFTISFTAINDKVGLKDLLSLQENVSSLLSSIGFQPEPLKAQDLLNLVYEILNIADESDELPDYNNNYYLNKQSISTNTTFFVDNEYFKVINHSKKRKKVWINLTPVSFSEQFHLVEFAKKIGDEFSDALNANQFNDNFIISITATRKNKNAVAKVKASHSTIVTQDWGSKFRKFENVRKESLEILDNIVEKREPLFEINIDVLVSGDTYKKANDNAQAIISFWQKSADGKSKIKLDKTYAIHHLSLLSNLPMHMNKEYFYKIGGKYITLFGHQVAHLFPAEYKVLNDGYNMPLISPKGYPAFIDLFVSNTNFNGYVIATSGSGKSVFLNILTFLSYARGDKIFILDYDNSFTGLCEVLHGQYLNLSPEKNVVSFNPFSDIKDVEFLKQELHYLSTLIYMLGSSKSQTRAEEDEKLIRTELQNIILELFDKYKNDLEITHIRDYILEKYDDTRFQDFAKQMGQYCKGGIYAGWFSGRCDFSVEKDLVAVEFKDVANHPDLRDPLVMLLMYHFGKVMYDDSPDKPRIQFILDEAHRFLNSNPMMDDFIEQAYRRARKFGASMIIATQGFGDVYSQDSGLTKVGRVIVENSSWKFFLKQQTTSAQSLINSNLFALSGLDAVLLKKTKTVKGEYSEIFIINPNDMKGVFRLIMPKFFYYLTTTDKAEKTKIAKLMKEHNKSKIEVIEEFLS